MCVTMELPGDRLITTSDQLRELLGHEPPWFPNAKDLEGEDTCICCIDIEAAADELGYRLTWLPDHEGPYCVGTRRCDA
jgi:hypothetical protein